MKNLIKAALLSSLALSLVSCNSSSNSKGSSAVSPAENNSLLTENYSYDFRINNCSTEKHTFTSLDALCKGLEDNMLNNNGCNDLETRAILANKRKDYFYQMCPGTFTPFTTPKHDNKTRDLNFQVLQTTQVINLLLNSSSETIQMQKKKRFPLIPVSFSCMNNETAMTAEIDGVILLKNSEIVIKKEVLNPAVLLNTSVLLSCASNSETDDPDFLEADYIFHNLKVGETLPTHLAILSRDTHSKPELAYIACVENEALALINPSAITITKGSKILVKKNSNFTKYDSRESMIISCE